ncbi:MAG: 50S ribosomal protein L25 [Candidatus Pacebacteria bacterium]|nr:50S ribosomal protein L25 [Candidatus Paceibacterota bacterium]
MITIQGTVRSKADKLDVVRANGMTPAVVYGAGTPSTSLSVPAQQFIKVFKEAGESEIVTLELEGKKLNVLIHEVQWHPVRDMVMHADFYVVDMNKEIEVAVPIEFTGVSEAVKLGGVLVKVMHELEIKSMPNNLPHEIMVDISALANLHDQIHVKDLKMPAGVEVLNDGDDVICIAEPAGEEMVEDAAPIDLSSIEVEKKGKKEEAEDAE